MRAYRITQWEGSHETHESRKLKFLPWVAAPNKHDGLGFSYLKAEPEQDRIEIWCAWKLMVDLCARAVREQRGWLMRSGKPLTAGDCAMMTGFPVRIFEKAFLFFCQPEVGWLEEQDVPPETLELPLDPPRSPGTPAASGKSPADSPGTPAASGKSPADSPGTPAASGKSPADSPGTPAASGKVLPGSAVILPTDRQTGSTGQTGSTEEREREALLRGSSEPSLAASKFQWGVNNTRKKEIEAKPRSEWTDAEREEWKKIRAELSKISKKQRAGVFA